VLGIIESDISSQRSLRCDSDTSQFDTIRMERGTGLCHHRCGNKTISKASFSAVSFDYEMDLFEKLFAHHRECEVIVCRRCRFAIVPVSMRGHIQSKHKTVTKSKCAQIVAFIDGLSHVAQHPEEVKYPDASSKAVPGLPVYTNGLRCLFEIAG
jgi:hypothetical protein